MNPALRLAFAGALLITACSSSDSSSNDGVSVPDSPPSSSVDPVGKTVVDGGDDAGELSESDADQNAEPTAESEPVDEFPLGSYVGAIPPILIWDREDDELVHRRVDGSAEPVEVVRVPADSMITRWRAGYITWFQPADAVTAPEVVLVDPDGTEVFRQEYTTSPEFIFSAVPGGFAIESVVANSETTEYSLVGADGAVGTYPIDDAVASGFTTGGAHFVACSGKAEGQRVVVISTVTGELREIGVGLDEPCNELFQSVLRFGAAETLIFGSPTDMPGVVQVVDLDGDQIDEVAIPEMTEFGRLEFEQCNDGPNRWRVDLFEDSAGAQEDRRLLLDVAARTVRELDEADTCDGLWSASGTTWWRRDPEGFLTAGTVDQIDGERFTAQPVDSSGMEIVFANEDRFAVFSTLGSREVFAAPLDGSAGRLLSDSERGHCASTTSSHVVVEASETLGDVAVEVHDLDSNDVLVLEGLSLRQCAERSFSTDGNFAVLDSQLLVELSSGAIFRYREPAGDLSSGAMWIDQRS